MWHSKTGRVVFQPASLQDPSSILFHFIVDENVIIRVRLLPKSVAKFPGGLSICFSPLFPGRAFQTAGCEKDGAVRRKRLQEPRRGGRWRLRLARSGDELVARRGVVGWTEFAVLRPKG